MTETTDLDDGPEVELSSDDDTEGATEEFESDDLDDEESDDLESDEEDEDTEPELIEVEYNGKTFKVAPELRDGIMFQADYTRKTQELAEKRKELDARFTEVEETSETENKARDNLAAIDAALQTFEQLDWDTLERQNPQEANRLFRNYTLLQQQRGGAEKELTEARSKREAETQRFYAERFEQSMTDLKQAIPDWGESKAVSLKTFAKEQFGFTDEEFKIGLHDPRQIKLLNLAYAASQASKAPKKPAVQPKPAAKVKGGSSPKKGLDDRLSTDEWMKRRQAQLSR